jgi:hypothetical protein
MSDERSDEKREKTLVPPSTEPQELSIEEFSIVELEDRLEFLVRCDNRCNAA